MTRPRNVRAGVTWFVTHRATRRHHLFTPDKKGVVEQLYWYTTAVYAKQLGIEVHLVQLMSTHIHEVLTDTRGELSRFLKRRNREFANALKVLRGWPEEVFRRGQSSWVELPTAEAVVKESAYTIVNCVAAALVPTPSKWPGAKVLAAQMGKRVVRTERPDMYFRAQNPLWPEQAELRIVMPQLLRQRYGSDQRCRQMVQTEVDKQVRKARADNKEQGRAYAGAPAVLRMRHSKRASSREPFGSRNPGFSAAGDLDVAARMVAERRAFLTAYRRAWQAWSRGERNVVFPYGTWKMRVHHGARCQPPP